jgi:hypothetical protein
VKPDKTEKFKIFLCAEIGEIYGLLTVSSSLLLFDPDVEFFKLHYGGVGGESEIIKKN